MESVIHAAEFGLAAIGSLTVAFGLARACLLGVLRQLENSPKDR